MCVRVRVCVCVCVCVLPSPALSCGEVFLHLDQHLGLMGLVHLTSEVTQKEPSHSHRQSRKWSENKMITIL